jgi:cell division inhibitor SepF
MSALHRLKAYFGMVPAEEFDAATGFDEAEFGAAEFDGYHPGHRSRYPASGHDSAGCNYPGERHYDDGFATPAGHYAASRAHPSRSPSSLDSRERSTRASGFWTAESWGANAPVRGSLAVDTAAAARTESRPMTRPPLSPQPFVHEPRDDLLTDDEAHPLSRIVTLHPHSYNEARPIGERYREGNPVIMNLTAMEDRDAKRLVDFAAGLAFALRGSIDKVTNKVFLLSPPNLDVSAEDRRRIAEGRLFT